MNTQPDFLITNQNLHFLSSLWKVGVFHLILLSSTGGHTTCSISISAAFQTTLYLPFPKIRFDELAFGNRKCCFDSSWDSVSRTFFCAGFLLLRGFRFLFVFSISGLCFSGVLLTWCCDLDEADFDCLENSKVLLGQTLGCCLFHVWISLPSSFCGCLCVARPAYSTFWSPIQLLHRHLRTQCPTIDSLDIQLSHADQAFQTSTESIANCFVEIQCSASGHPPQPLQFLYPYSKWWSLDSDSDDCPPPWLHRFPRCLCLTTGWESAHDSFWNDRYHWCTITISCPCHQAWDNVSCWYQLISCLIADAD